MAVEALGEDEEDGRRRRPLEEEEEEVLVKEMQEEAFWNLGRMAEEEGGQATYDGWEEEELGTGGLVFPPREPSLPFQISLV